MKITACALTALMMMGCAPQKSLTIYTDPPGATLYEEGGQTYTSPVTVHYDIANVDPAYIDAEGCLLVQPFTAIWSSGARVDSNGLLRLCGQHSTFAMTIERPDVPGLEQDLKMADLLAERALLKEIQRLEGQAAMSEGIGTLAEGITCQASGGCSDGRPRYPREVRTACREDAFGNTFCSSKAY